MTVTNTGHVLLAVLLLALITTVLLSAYHRRPQMAQLLAVVRGAAQLAAVSLILSAVIESYAWIAAALALMFGVALVTATRRIGWSPRHATVVGAAMALGIATALGVIFLTGAVDVSPRYLLALGGIIIGNAMTAATLAGRNYQQQLDSCWPEVEGWLALGATERQATHRITRCAVRDALVPSTDQAKTTGLVTLPGAFVGAIFGGLSPIAAGQFQVLVLTGILTAGSITAVIVVTGLIRPLRKPVPEP